MNIEIGRLQRIAFLMDALNVDILDVIRFDIATKAVKHFDDFVNIGQESFVKDYAPYYTPTNDEELSRFVRILHADVI